MKISLILLTYNEFIGVKEIFKKLPLQYVDEYFAIDGGSTDGTLKLFEKNNIPYWSCINNPSWDVTSWQTF